MLENPDQPIHPLVPSFIVSHAAADRRRGSFQAVALFADVSGFTAMTDALMAYGQEGAEVLAGVMRSVFEPLMLAAYEWGGFIADQAGDGFTALFPAGELTTDGNNGDYLWCALTAAWEMRLRAEANSVHPTPHGQFTISVKVGLAEGVVNWGIISAPNSRRAAYYFSGAAVDGSAEAQSLAGAGEIILDAGLYRRVKDRTQAEPAGSFFRLVAIGPDRPAGRPAAPAEMDPVQIRRFFAESLLTLNTLGEFRQVTCLFVSLPTVRTQDQLESFIQTVFELQDRYGGLLKLQFGDKGAHLMLIWGAPVAFESDTRRAVNFILDLQTQTAIPIHGGLTSRLAHVGFIGSRLAEEYAAFGRGVNLAARFMTAAPRGELWVDEQVARKAEAIFELEYLGEKAFKGFAQPQKVYLLLERKEQSEIAYEGDLVGRSSELAMIDGFVQPIFAEKFAGALGVFGDPGMGKSRLVHEYLHRLDAAYTGSYQFFLAQTDEILRRSLNPFRYWLRRYFGVTEMQVESRNKRSFNRKIDELIAATPEPHLAEELDRTRSFIAALVGLTWPDSTYAQMDSEARYENTLNGLIALLSAEGLRRPTIFFLEDVQWLDEDSRAFLPRLVRALAAGSLENGSPRQFPVALIITARQGIGESGLDGILLARIDLHRLDRVQLAALAAGHLGGSPADSLLNFLELHAEGNPFFVEQILKFARERTLLNHQSGGWSLQPAANIQLPGDLNSVLVARLDRLTQQVKAIVQTAAVLGREFEVRLLAEMLHGDRTLYEKVHQAEQEEIWAPLSEIRYIFRHALMRDAAYNMQVQAQRRRLHALALEALERLFAADPALHHSELAHHADQAGLSEKALSYYKLAAAAAINGYQNSLAIDYLSRALDLIPEADLAERSELLLEREKIYELVGANDLRRQDLDALARISDRFGDPQLRDQLLLRQSDYYMGIGEYAKAQALAEQLVDKAIAAGDTQAAVKAGVGLCLILFRQGKHEAAERQAKAGLELARRVGDRQSENSLLNALGLMAVELRDVEAARGYFDACRQIAEETGDLRDLSRALNNLGMVHGVASDYSAARISFEQALVHIRKIGKRAGEGILLANLGWIAGALGDYTRAREYVEQGLRIDREVELPYNEAYALLNLSGFSGALGDPETSLQYAEQALEISMRLGDRSMEAWGHTYRGHGLLALGRHPEAKNAYAAALEIRNEMNQQTLAAEPAAGLAQTALLDGEPLEALQMLTGTLGLIDGGDELEGCDEPMRVYDACYRVLKACNDARANSILEAAYRLLIRRAAGIGDEQARQGYFHNNVHHRRILAAWEQEQSAQRPG